MEEFRETDVVTYFSKKVGSGDIVPLDELWSEVDNAPRRLKRYIRRKYRNVEQFEMFLENNPRTFFVENGMVTWYTPELENGRRNTVEYFKEVLEDYKEAPNNLNFRGHVVSETSKEGEMEESRETDVITYFSDRLVSGDIIPLDELWSEVDKAPRHLKRYMRRKYRNVKQFERFLENNPRTFFVENGMVTRYTPELENGRRDAVEYFEGVLKDYEEASNCLNFRGHAGQASDDVKAFINTFYTGTSFKDFLLSRWNVFVVFGDNTVWLIGDAVGYFKGFLTELGDKDAGMHYRSLRGHIGQAERYVQKFINTYYPGDKFKDFLLENDKVFEVLGEDIFIK